MIRLDGVVLAHPGRILTPLHSRSPQAPRVLVLSSEGVHARKKPAPTTCLNRGVLSLA